jgi:hypothetical protein
MAREDCLGSRVMPPELPLGSAAVSIPLDDGLVVVAPTGALYALNAAGRCLWEAICDGCTIEQLVAISVEQGGLDAGAAREWITDTLTSWREVGLLGHPACRGSRPADDTGLPARPPGRNPTFDATYRLGDRPVRIRCDDPVLGDLIDAACRPFRENVATAEVSCVDIVDVDGSFAVHAEGARLANASTLAESPASARHRCLTAVLDLARPDHHWLGILHASAVAEDRRCLILAGASGSGKSTLASALVASGASFVTDDYAPLERASWLVWPVPYAPSVKEGSWPVLGRYYPNLLKEAVHYHRGLRLRYLELTEQSRAPLDEGLPVCALVFPRFQDGSALELTRVTPTEALRSLCWTASIMDRQPDAVAETVRWIQSVPAYELRFGDLDAAVERMRALIRRA